MKKLLVACGLCLSTACSKSAPPPGKPLAIESVCNEAEASRVRVTGYLRYQRGLLSFCSSFGGNKTCDLALYAAAQKPPDFDVMHPQRGLEPVHVELSVPVGDDPGEMADLPKEFKDSDIVLHLPGKASVSEGGHVTIDGSVSVVPADPAAPGGARPRHCWVKVEWASPG